MSTVDKVLLLQYFYTYEFQDGDDYYAAMNCKGGGGGLKQYLTKLLQTTVFYLFFVFLMFIKYMCWYLWFFFC